MAKQRLTDREFIGQISRNDLIHFVVTGDTSQNPAGSSYKGTVGQLLDVDSTYTAVTYSQITNLISSSGLTEGSFYLISDFQTIYDQPDFDVYGSPKVSVTTKTGDTEPILVLATSNNTLSLNAWSLSYPNDKISYDVTFSQTEVMSASAKGRITERVDNMNNRTDYDHRSVLFKRYETINGSSIFNSYKDTGFASIELPTFNDLTSDNNNYLGDYANSPVWGFLLSNNVFGPSFSYNTFGGGSNNNTLYYVLFAKLNRIGGNFSDNVISNNFYFNQIGINCTGNIISNTFSDNNIGDSFINNQISGPFRENSIGFAFYSNVITSFFVRNITSVYFHDNEIPCYFTDNVIGPLFENNTFYGSGPVGSCTSNVTGYRFRLNDIEDSFGTNKIGEQFESNYLVGVFYGNTVETNFGGNWVQSAFTGNVIKQGVSMSNCTTTDYFQNNIILTYLPSVDFSTATHVYQQYTCELVDRQDGTKRLKYMDNTDAIIVTDITD